MGIKRNMLNKLASGLLSAGMLLATFNPALAQSARNASWTVSITYQNIGSASTPVTLNLFQEGQSAPAATLTASDLPASNPLGQGAATSYFVGNLNDPDFTNGNGVMSSEQPLAATVVQFVNVPAGTPDDDEIRNFRMRLLYNGFPDSKAAAQYLVATTLLNTFGSTTVFSIQNTEASPIEATVTFYDAAAGGANVGGTTHVIAGNSSKFIEMDDASDTGLGTRTTLNGSAIVTAKLQGSDTDASVVVAASEYFTAEPLASNFEGVPLTDAATTIYMATGLCQAFNNDSFYAIQNASTTAGDDAEVTINYYNTDGSLRGTDTGVNLGPGEKYSANTCVVDSVQGGGSMAGFTGSAVITSNGAPLVAIGKVINSLQAGAPDKEDYRTAFLSEKQGYNELSLPFIRWANDDRFNQGGNVGQFQRAFIAVQNLGDAAVRVRVRYVDFTGAVVGTHIIENVAPSAKANSNPSLAPGALGAGDMNDGEFGYYSGGRFGGGAIIDAVDGSGNPIATAELIAIARLQHPGAAEDYNGVPIP